MSDFIFISTIDDATCSGSQFLRFDGRDGTADYWRIDYDTFRERRNGNRWEMAFQVVSQEIGTNSAEFYREKLQEALAWPRTWKADKLRAKSIYWYFYDSGASAERAFIHDAYIEGYPERRFTASGSSHAVADLVIVRDVLERVTTDTQTSGDIDGKTQIWRIPPLNDAVTRNLRLEATRKTAGSDKIVKIWMGIKPYNVEAGETSSNSAYQPWITLSNFATNEWVSNTLLSATVNTESGHPASFVDYVPHWYGRFTVLIRWKVSNSTWTGKVESYAGYRIGATEYASIQSFETIYINSADHTDHRLTEVGTVNIPTGSVRSYSFDAAVTDANKVATVAGSSRIYINATQDGGSGNFEPESVILIPADYAVTWSSLNDGDATLTRVEENGEPLSQEFAITEFIRPVPTEYGVNTPITIPRQGGVMTAIALDENGKHLNFTDLILNAEIVRTSIRDE